ncbi:DEAD/DEAH box helicase [Microbacterium sp. GXF6406]
MPKSGKPKGGRPSQNFEPRYAKKTSFHDRHNGGRPASRGDSADAGERSFDRRPGSKSPNHRGYRPAEADNRAPKQRWSNEQRAGRDEARGIRGERPRYNNERPSFNRDDRGGDRRFDDRPRRDERGGDRPRYNSERPSFNRDDRGGDRPRYNSDRNDRPRYNNDRPSFNRDDRGGERPRYNSDRPSFNRDDRGGDRPRFNRDDRGGDRPRYNSDRNERPRYNNDRPSFNRDDRGGDRPRYNSDRPSFNRDDRGGDRPRYNNDRPARDERPRYSSDRNERPRFTRDERPSRDDRPRRDDRAQRPNRSDWNAKPAKSYEPTEDVVHEKLKANVIAAPEVEGTTFGDLGLGSNIVETLANMGAAAPFPIQAATIPSILAGRDVLGRGRTGSGKTIAFGSPLVERILKEQKGKRREFGRKPQAIILAPTRELALQIDRTVQPIARSVGLFTTQIYGGVPQGRQVGALKKGVDIIIGTPGRVEDLINQGKLDLSDCRIAVLDEADHMCELGFVEPVQRILRHTAEGSQKLLFSATLDREVAALVDEFLVDPAVYEVAGEDQDSSTIEHRVLVIEHRDKAEILNTLVDREGKTLVFARTRAYAEMLAEQFEDAGIPAVALHGDLNQAKRTRNLQKMTAGRVNVLVATDVAARGIHVDDIDLVIQADAPDEYKTYMHRSGRTGRAGRTGRVVTLITRQRQRRTSDLLERAEIDAPFEQARLGDDILAEIAGSMPTVEELTA